MNGKFQGFRLIIQNMVKSFHIASDSVLHCPDITEDGISRNIFRINNAADIQIVNNICIRKTVYLGDELGLCHCFRKQGKENVFLIKISQRNEGFHCFQTFLDQKGTVCAIAVDDRCGRKLFTEKFTALRILLNNFKRDPGIGECFREVIGNCSSPNDQSVSDLVRFQADFFEKERGILRRCDNGNKVSVMYKVISARDGQFVFVFNRAEKNVASVLLRDFGNRHSVQPELRKDFKFQKLYPSSGERIDFNCCRKTQQAGNFTGRGKFRIDDH